MSAVASADWRDVRVLVTCGAFVHDVVAGMMMVATLPNISGQTIDLGSGVLLSIRQVVEDAAALIGSRVPIAFGSLPDCPFERPRIARVEETSQLTVWSAATSLTDGLRKTVDSWAATFARNRAGPR